MSKLEITFWDVEHGHATYIKTPNGRHIVVDLGIGSYHENNETFSPLVYLKDKWKVKQLDYVIITHPHLDHIDDILNFDSLNPKVFQRPKHLTNFEVMTGVREQDKSKFVKYCELNDYYSEPVTSGSENDLKMADHWGGVSIKTFSAKNCPKSNFNNHSIIVVIEYLNTKIIIPGDNEKCSLEELMENEDFKEAIKGSEILLAPHHGRESGYNLDFINLVNPYITVVSDGSICDTSANGRYSAKSKGWEVLTRSKGVREKRNCLTTNSDGVVRIEISPSNTTEYKSVMEVSVE